jgi:hypothetical protein
MHNLWRVARRSLTEAAGFPDYLAAKAAGVARLLASRPADAIKWKPYEVMRLYRDIRQRKPQTVMEFGVGCSTMVIAHALFQNGSGRHICVDASHHWLSVCREAMPSHLSPLVSFHHSTVRVIDVSGRRAHVYEQVPNCELDYLFLDGPAKEDIPDWPRGKALAADPIFMQSQFRPGFRLVVEGREENAELLREQLKNFSCRKEQSLNSKWTIFDLLGL